MYGDAPAFPVPEFAIDGMIRTAFESGVTKREWLAALAMQALCHNDSNCTEPSSWNMAEYAQHAVRAADALIAELNKPAAVAGSKN